MHSSLIGIGNVFEGRYSGEEPAGDWRRAITTVMGSGTQF